MPSAREAGYFSPVELFMVENIPPHTHTLSPAFVHPFIHPLYSPHPPYDAPPLLPMMMHRPLPRVCQSQQHARHPQ